jgi:anaerobic selenocysteine-containing dehydrogenase
VFAEISAIAYGGLDYGLVGEHAPLPPPVEPGKVQKPKRKRAASGKGLRLIAYRPLFSGPAVERVPELHFQRPGPEIELSPDDARRLGVANDQLVHVKSNGTSVELRARITKDLASGAVRVPGPYAGDLGTHVEVSA